MTATQKKIREEIARRLINGEITQAQYDAALAHFAAVDKRRKAGA